MPDEKLDALLFEMFGYSGRLLSGSKSGYEARYPTHKTVFNANLIVEGQGKVWFGDLDLTLEAEKLQKLATDVGAKVYVLREKDARFQTEANPLIQNAVATYEPQTVNA